MKFQSNSKDKFKEFMCTFVNLIDENTFNRLRKYFNLFI